MLEQYISILRLRILQNPRGIKKIRMIDAEMITFHHNSPQHMHGLAASILLLILSTRYIARARTHTVLKERTYIYSVLYSVLVNTHHCTCTSVPHLLYHSTILLTILRSALLSSTSLPLAIFLNTAVTAYMDALRVTPATQTSDYVFDIIGLKMLKKHHLNV